MRCRSHRLANLLLRELGERTAAYMNMIAATGLSSVRQRVVLRLLDLAAEGTAARLSRISLSKSWLIMWGPCGR